MKTMYIFNEKTKKFIATTALSGLVAVGVGCEVPDIVYNQYSNSNQVNIIARELGYDMDNLMDFKKDEYSRFLHNDAPICVTISNGLKAYENDIKAAMDEIFSILHNINDKYSYQIVEDGEIPFGSSVIRIKDKIIDEDFVNGCVSNLTSTLPIFMTDALYFKEANINVDLEEITNSKASLYSIVLHEAGHVFTLGDVYMAGQHKSTDAYVANTMMNVDLGGKIPKFTPYDVARLVALYTPTAENKQDLKDKISHAKDYLENYTQEYYDFYTTAIKQSVEKASGLTMRFEDVNSDDAFTFNTSISIHDDKTTYGYEYEVSYADDKYRLQIFDENGKLLDECSGDTIIDNGVMVLRDMKLHEAMRPDDKVLLTPDGYVQDLTMFGWTDAIHMYDATDNNIMYGTVNYVENDLSL